MAIQDHNLKYSNMNTCRVYGIMSQKKQQLFTQESLDARDN